MKGTKLSLYFVTFGILTLLFWHSIIPGIFFGLILPIRYARITTLTVSAVVAFLFGVVTGSFIPGVDMYFDLGYAWPFIEFVLGWTFCALLFYAGYHVPQSYADGMRAAPTKT